MGAFGIDHRPQAQPRSCPCSIDVAAVPPIEERRVGFQLIKDLLNHFLLEPNPFRNDACFGRQETP